MLLVEYLNSQFSLTQNVDFFLRIVVACLCGALIGAERSKRFKEAGVRTHIIVCCAAAIMMIVSKYGFADLTSAAGGNFNGTRGADPARVAAQVVSGISFLGAGVIFKYGSTVKGLTSAAGLWATAGIGLAIGAGMYPVGVVSAVLIVILQSLMHKFVVGADSLSSSHLTFTVRWEDAGTQELLADYILEHGMQLSDTKIVYHDDGFISYDLILRSNKELTITELSDYLRAHGELRSVGVVPVS